MRRPYGWSHRMTMPRCMGSPGHRPPVRALLGLREGVGDGDGGLAVSQVVGGDSALDAGVLAGAADHLADEWGVLSRVAADDDGSALPRHCDLDLGETLVREEASGDGVGSDHVAVVPLDF